MSNRVRLKRPTRPMYVLPPSHEDSAWFREALKARMEEIRVWLGSVEPREEPFKFSLTGPLADMDTPPTVCDRCGARGDFLYMEPHLTTTGHKVAVASALCTACATREGWVQ